MTIADRISNPTVTDAGTTSHDHCTHDATKAGRAWCRRAAAKAAGVPNAKPKTIAANTIPAESIVGESITTEPVVWQSTWEEAATVLAEEIKRLQKRSTKELSTMMTRADLTDTTRRAASAIIDRRTR